MSLDLATPALLFSALSLLLLAYTNRFLAIANLVRSLYAEYQSKKDHIIMGQIKNLRRRLELIRWMQLYGIISLLLCVLAMFLVYIKLNDSAIVIFGLALVMLIISLTISALEINISVHALNLHLNNIEENK